jgi:hypothetical protein
MTSSAWGSSVGVGRGSIAVGMVFCLLLLSGPVYAQTVRHAAHHAHHNAATHGTGLCSLMCAAGQVLEASPFEPHVVSAPVSTLLDPSLSEPASTVPAVCSSRGPPTLSI